jgi:SAM-dependent methyltransferase
VTLSDVTIALAVGLFVFAAAFAYFIFASFVFGAGYQPTPRRSVETMLRFAEVGPQDTLYDLGAGTGAIVFRAARVYRARVIGVEVEPLRYLILKWRRAWGPFADRITLHWGDLFDLEFRDATVVSAFLWPRAMARLKPKLEAELPPGARIVSHCHPVRGWTPEKYDEETDVYLYRRPPAGATVTTGDK